MMFFWPATDEYKTDVDQIEEDETKTFPDIDFLIKEDKYEINNATAVENAITKECTAIHLTIWKNSNTSSNYCCDKHTCTNIRTYTDFSHSWKNRNNKRENIWCTVTKCKESNT